MASGFNKNAYFVVTFFSTTLFPLLKPTLFSSIISSIPEFAYFSFNKSAILSLLPLSITLILKP